MDYAAIEYASDNAFISLGLTAKGDMLALKRFADAELNPSPESSKDQVKKRDERKRQLYDMIISKSKQRKNNSSFQQNPSSLKPVANRTRHVSIGWMHYDDKKNKYVSVRYARGGGCRELSLSAFK